MASVLVNQYRNKLVKSPPLPFFVATNGDIIEVNRLSLINSNRYV